MPTYLTADDLHRALRLRDLTDPAQGHHALQLLLDDVIQALARSWCVRVRTVRTPPIVSVADNYDQLGFSPRDVTRDQRYSRYLSPTTMLRSHTSADIPAALRARASEDPPAVRDELIVVPGLVHRRDVIDRTHVGEPHQVDLWRLRVDHRVSGTDPDDLAGAVVDAVLPGARWRATPSPHPYTDLGRQLNVHHAQEWLDLAEFGLIADLGPWRPVSRLPPIRRDLSVVIDDPTDDEQLGDLVRLVLRPLGRTLTDREANALRNDVYRAIHRGTRLELA